MVRPSVDEVRKMEQLNRAQLALKEIARIREGYEEIEHLDPPPKFDPWQHLIVQIQEHYEEYVITPEFLHYFQAFNWKEVATIYEWLMIKAMRHVNCEVRFRWASEPEEANGQHSIIAVEDLAIELEDYASDHELWWEQVKDL